MDKNYTPNEIIFNWNMRVILPKIVTRKINYNTVKKAITHKQQKDKKQYKTNIK